MTPVMQMFWVFLKLGATCFGGPVAHLGYFKDEFVRRRGWLDDSAFAHLLALCQFLPGPASSQMGIAIGMRRAGIAGGFAAWLGFTLPSALLMLAFGLGMEMVSDANSAGWLHGLKIAAIAVVAQAVWSLWATLCTDAPRRLLALAAACIALAQPTSLGQLGAIAMGGLLGWWCFRGETAPAKAHSESARQPARTLGAAAWLLFFALLLLLPVAARESGNHGIALFDSFYRSGALVFGGGHVVLPMLRAEVVPPGWIGDDAFLAGYGVAQALPGPLFTFAAYLGVVMQPAPTGIAGGLLCLVAIFLPSFLLLWGALPWWERLRANRTARAALAGINAAVVGLLLSALYHPLWTTTILGRTDFILALIIFGLLAILKSPPVAVVALAALAGALMS